jgi:hypothetical protein
MPKFVQMEHGEDKCDFGFRPWQTWHGCHCHYNERNWSFAWKTNPGTHSVPRWYVPVGEYHTSQRCCMSRGTDLLGKVLCKTDWRRTKGDSSALSLKRCYKCRITCNRDFNATLNMGYVALYKFIMMGNTCAPPLQRVRQCPHFVQLLSQIYQSKPHVVTQSPKPQKRYSQPVTGPPAFILSRFHL